MPSTSDVNRIGYFLLKRVSRACKEFDLLEEGDRVAVAVSGGKDSRALLQLLLRHRRRVPFRYDILALHIVGTPAGFEDQRPSLEPWFRELGVDAHFALLDLPDQEPLPLDCFRCSWNRRKAIFTAAAELDYTKVAFGHNADDAAGTTLLNLLFTGRLETMAPRVAFFEQKITLVRPLIYVPEKELVRFGRAAGFPDTPPCPQGLTSQRARMKAVLRQFGRDQKQIRANLWRAARRQMGF